MNVADEHRRYAPEKLRFAVVTASDSRREAEDDSGSRIAAMATASGHTVVSRTLVRDDRDRIRAAVEIAATAADVVVLNGGTGFSPRDVSVDAVTPILERRIEGFGELFRLLSHRQIGAAAMLSRATAGIVGRSAVFVIPGSPAAVELAMRELILPESAHLIGQLQRGSSSP